VLLLLLVVAVFYMCS